MKTFFYSGRTSSIVIGGDFMGMPELAARRAAPRIRWYVCGLLFFATTINYVDRQVLGLLKPVLEKELGWREADYGWIVFAFQLAYALMMPFAGRLIDWVGTRLGYAVSVALWSVAAMGHALARSAMGFGVARFALGLSESANFPAAIRTVADWFPQRERALATGIFNSGANIGAILAPLAVPYLALHYGWRAAFIVTGAAGLAWVLLWWCSLGGTRMQLSPPSSEEEIVRPPLGSLLTSRTAWAFILGKFLTDPAWWFYLFWLPGFLNRVYGLDLAHLGLPIIVVYQASTVGSIGGGSIPSVLLKRGWPPNRAREAAMLICAVAVTSVIFVGTGRVSMWTAVALVGVATAAHQGWSANLYTLASDLFPRGAVGSVVGLGGFGGAVGGMLVAPLVGYWLDWSHGVYGPLFVIAGSIYLVAFGVIHWLTKTGQDRPGGLSYSSPR
jgi:ACS family hexuronate transporter-like MFS transporter